MNAQRGLFFVVEGTDGSGKATQVGLLAKKLRKEGRKVEILDFPQYHKPSSYFVGKYLRGEYGASSEVGPYRASLFYALDRYDASFHVRKWLAEGKVVISNRYTSANMGHQAGKIFNARERNTFLKWLIHLEYSLLDIPQPDMTLLLYVDPREGQRLVGAKKRRKYLRGARRDIHERDLAHLTHAADAFRLVARKYGWTTIECMHRGTILPIHEIHMRVYEKVAPFFSEKKKQQ